ncbi:MAG TPA: acyl-CoA thioesterase [Candidatus Ornithomonoglobus merdipullorum]|uniref:Acyl-CoA thioesterase n=1 Tax=Candidatus Ornithomonoglobus merdipullorum TaxID=2840895 RepID=A0A9D1SEL5_9FIRM|nr:acyl-CoA thioesterase [Candidatus Ornithomonoglobus merdipullorum]
MAYKSETRLTVRYAETDMMGIVHHSRYYPWFEQARTDFIKRSGLTYSQMEKMGILLPLTETQCRYIYGLTYEDEVLITCEIEKLTVARIEFAYEVYKLPEMKKASEGKTKHGFVDKDMRPLNLKKAFPEVWEKLSGLA